MMCIILSAIQMCLLLENTSGLTDCQIELSTSRSCFKRSKITLPSPAQGLHISHRAQCQPCLGFLFSYAYDVAVDC